MSSPGRRVSNASDSRLQLFLGIIRGLDRKTDAALDFVHFDDARLDFLTDLEHIFHLRDVIFAQLRNVHEAIDVVLQLHERTEARELGYLALNQIADLVFRIDFLPRIFAQLFDAQTDALVRLVDVDDYGFDFVVLLKYFARMIDLSGPAQIGNVDHPIDAILQFHERAVSGHVANLSLHAAADR